MADGDIAADLAIAADGDAGSDHRIGADTVPSPISAPGPITDAGADSTSLAQPGVRRYRRASASRPAATPRDRTSAATAAKACGTEATGSSVMPSRHAGRPGLRRHEAEAGLTARQANPPIPGRRKRRSDATGPRLQVREIRDPRRRRPHPAGSVDARRAQISAKREGPAILVEARIGHGAGAMCPAISWPDSAAAAAQRSPSSWAASG